MVGVKIPTASSRYRFESSNAVLTYAKRSCKRKRSASVNGMVGMDDGRSEDSNCIQPLPV